MPKSTTTTAPAPPATAATATEFCVDVVKQLVTVNKTGQTLKSGLSKLVDGKPSPQVVKASEQLAGAFTYLASVAPAGVKTPLSVVAKAYSGLASAMKSGDIVKLEEALLNFYKGNVTGSLAKVKTWETANCK